jgi:hypothetical protein
VDNHRQSGCTNRWDSLKSVRRASGSWHVARQITGSARDVHQPSTALAYARFELAQPQTLSARWLAPIEASQYQVGLLHGLAKRSAIDRAPPSQRWGVHEDGILMGASRHLA